MFRCSRCGRSFETQKALSSHIRWHKNPRPPIPKGWHHSEEAKEKIRQANIKMKAHLRFHTPEAVRKASDTRRRKYGNNPPWLSEEAQKKRSESLKRFYEEHPERKERSREQFIRNVLKAGKHNNGLPPTFHLSKSSIEEIRNTVIKNYKENHEIIEIIREKRLKQVFPTKDSSIELKMQDALKGAKIDFVTHHPFYLKGFGTQIDIAVLDRKIAIYCDGDYWHNLPNYKQRDRKVNKILKEQGWVVLRFWEHEINENVNLCVAKVKEVMRLKSH